MIGFNSLKNDGDQQAVIFLHIPKTAGSTLNSIITRQYREKDIYSIDTKRVIESMEEFKYFPQHQLEKIKLLKGHMYFGLHEYLPMPSTYITILREPIDRVLSTYYYVMRQKNHNHYEIANQTQDIKNYILKAEPKQFDNGQTRLLAGMDAIPVEFGNCSNQMLEAAKNNLKKHFSVVGTTERFDETLILIKQKLGWHLPLYAKKNVTNKRPKKKQISQDILDTIVELNQLDLELYKYAEVLLQKAIKQQQPNLLQEVERFKFYNNALGNSYHLFHKMISLNTSQIYSLIQKSN
jgi:hypothetical protein